ncbi:hypothetical protein [Longimicrobium terrae]|uniref:Capsule assembly Wzi family protein n=1 Tax=Longimicrobium terrae TaxID=1639882 RepID=A0A841H631_9BACT|nr:hypothetical protein [Longimicrobium terrae]MBB4639328.1 hypothetical protein [Longimicrobium terrae]MBB6073601.1 hypothetical protein [Longimicrobium terrae]NNC29392.1 hypothetical protein [Longimicrobium terrae]
MYRLFSAAILVLGIASHGTLAAQHTHGGAQHDSAHAATITPAACARMLADTAHRVVRADTAHQRVMLACRRLVADSARMAAPAAPPAAHDHMTMSAEEQARMTAPAAPPAAHAAMTANEHAGHAMGDSAMDHGSGVPGAGHGMWMAPLGGGWSVMGMAQAYLIATSGLAPKDSPLRRTELYLTQPAAMINLQSPGSALVLRTTLNVEGLTQPDGELTFGGWGEGFIDRRHPHTLLHEAMVSANLWNAAGGSFSLSAGKGFAPYGTDDPMSRPVAKYPTNHHLSQILERWTVNAVYLRGPWSVEAGWFGGQEPDGAYDFSNIESFGDSWSARLIRRFGGTGTTAPWEVSGSYGSVSESHDGHAERTALLNTYARHAGRYRWGTLYGLAEASRSEPRGDEDGYWAVLGEAMGGIGRARPYGRVEYSTRPEFEREGAGAENDGFFRYHHDDEPIGATRWLIGTAGFGWQMTDGPVATMPFVEVQHFRASAERGGVEPRALFGASTFWSVSAGFRVFLGSAGPMRMGSYGVLDDMTSSHGPHSATAGMGSH